MPPEARRQATAAYALFARDPFYPGLQFKEVARWPGIWSARVGIHHRVLGRRAGDRIEWFWIGTHSEYDQILR